MARTVHAPTSDRHHDQSALVARSSPVVANGADQQRDPEQADDHADHGPENLAGHERAVQRARPLRDPHSTECEEEDPDDPPNPHQIVNAMLSTTRSPSRTSPSTRTNPWARACTPVQRPPARRANVRRSVVMRTVGSAGASSSNTARP